MKIQFSVRNKLLLIADNTTELYALNNWVASEIEPVIIYKKDLNNKKLEGILEQDEIEELTVGQKPPQDVILYR